MVTVGLVVAVAWMRRLGCGDGVCACDWVVGLLHASLVRCVVAAQA